MLPLAKRSEILRRHQAVEVLLRLESTTEMLRLRSQLKELGGLPQTCYKLNMGVGSTTTWASLLKVMLLSRAIRRCDHILTDTALAALEWSVDLQCSDESSCRAQQSQFG